MGSAYKRVEKTYGKGRFTDRIGWQYLCLGLNHGKTNLHEFCTGYLEAKEKHESTVYLEDRKS